MDNYEFLIDNGVPHSLVVVMSDEDMELLANIIADNGDENGEITAQFAEKYKDIM